jgi:hypothetical protein
MDHRSGAVAWESEVPFTPFRLYLLSGGRLLATGHAAAMQVLRLRDGKPLWTDIRKNDGRAYGGSILAWSGKRNVLERLYSVREKDPARVDWFLQQYDIKTGTVLADVPLHLDAACKLLGANPDELKASVVANDPDRPWLPFFVVHTDPRSRRIKSTAIVFVNKADGKIAPDAVLNLPVEEEQATPYRHRLISDDSGIWYRAGNKHYRITGR